MEQYTVEELEEMLKQAYVRRAQNGESVAYAPQTATNARNLGGVEAGRPMTTAEYKTQQIARRALEQKTESEKADRVLQILRAHPEFFDFIEVLQSGLV